MFLLVDSYDQLSMTPRQKAIQVSQSFPARLKAVRDSCGYTQEQLAEIVGCSAITLSKFETGVNLPSFENLISIATALNISVDGLLGMSIDDDQISPRRTEAKVRLDKATSDLSAEWIDTLTQLALKAK